MKKSRWIQQYRNEQKQIHMPMECRMRILQAISEEETAEPISDSTKQYTSDRPLKHAKRKAHILPVLIAAAVAISATAISLRFTCAPATQPDDQDQPPQHLEIYVPATKESDMAYDQDIQELRNKQMKIDTDAIENDKLPTKSQVYYKCTHTGFFLSKISGSIYFSTQGKVNHAGKFSMDFENDQYFQYTWDKNIDAGLTRRQNEQASYFNKNELHRVYRNADGSIDVIHDTDRPTFSRFILSDYPSRGETYPPLETDATDFTDDVWADNSSLDACYMPTAYAETLLSDFSQWEVTSYVQTNSGLAVEVDGKCASGPFSLLINWNTGVWILLKVFDETSETSEGDMVEISFWTRNLSFDDAAEDVPLYKPGNTVLDLDPFDPLDCVNHQYSEEIRN